MRKLLLYLTVFVFIFSIYSRDAENKKRGYISALKGDAQKRKADEYRWLEAKLRMDVESRDILRTLPESFAEIALKKGSRIRLAPKTIVNMVKLYEETENKLITKMKVQKGEIWGNVRDKGEREVFEFESTAISSSVVGTEFRIQTHKKGSKIKVYRGQVEVKGVIKKEATNKDKKEDIKIKKPDEIEGPTEIEGPKEVTMEEWTLIVKEMMELEVNKDGEIVKYRSINTKREDDDSEWYRWNKERDKELIIK